MLKTIDGKISSETLKKYKVLASDMDLTLGLQQFYNVYDIVELHIYHSFCCFVMYIYCECSNDGCIRCIFTHTFLQVFDWSNSFDYLIVDPTHML